MTDRDMPDICEDFEEPISKPEKAESRKVLQRVYTRLHNERILGGAVENNTLRLFKLTGINLGILQRLVSGEVVSVADEVDRADIIKTLHSIYVHQKYMPKTMQLFTACQSFLPAYMDISGFRKLLFKYDFVWKRISNQNFVVIERPEITYERYKYLRTVLNYSYDVYFIEENYYDETRVLSTTEASKLSKTQEKTKQMMIYAASHKEIIFNGNFKTQFTQKSFKDWITQELLPNVKKQSMFVFKNSEHHCEMHPWNTDLTIESLRFEMTNWLDLNNVPYDPLMSKAELYTLIENCTDVESNKYVIDGIIRSQGHVPVRLPDHLSCLNPAELLSAHFNKSLKVGQKIKMPAEMKIAYLLLGIKSSILKKCCDEVFEEYRRLLDVDLQVDLCLEHLLLKMDQVRKSVEYNDSDLPSLSEDSD